MQYQSLIRFLEYADIDYSQEGRANIARFKKQVIAEFAMQPDGVITLEGISYTKHEILKELDHPELGQRLEYHLILWKYPSLLGLLEHDELCMAETAAWYPLHLQQGFVHFLSPYFAPAFNSVLKTLLKNNNLYDASSWLDYLGFIESVDEEQALAGTRIFLEDTIRLFRNLNDQSYRQRIEELDPWINDPWSLFINKLPAGLLHYTDELANVIINFTVRIQKSDRKMCYRISSELLRLKQVNYSLKQLIASNHAIYKKNYENSTLTGRLSRVSPTYFIVVGLIVLLRIFVGADSDDTGKDYQFTSPVLTGYAVTEEDREYDAVHDFYQQEYKRYKTATTQNYKNTDLGTTPFSSKPVYLFVEHDSTGKNSLYPFAISNNTGERIKVDILSAGNVSNVVIGAGDLLGVAPERPGNSDLILSFNQDNVSARVIPEVKELQYIHIAADASAPYHFLSFARGEVIHLPVVLQKNIDTFPLRMTIEGKGGQYYFQIKGKGQLVQFKALPVQGT